MRRFVEVVHGHPLSDMHCYQHGLPLGNVRVTSLKMGYYYLNLQHHGQSEAARTLLVHPKLKWQPDLIAQWCQKSVSTPNINFLCRSRDIMRGIILHQAEVDDSPFYDAFDEELKGIDAPLSLRLRVYTSSVNEYIFSSGNKYDAWKEPVPGFNFHAELLDEMVKVITRVISTENPLFGTIMNNFHYFTPAIYNSVLIVSDSQGKFFDRIVGGTVVPVRGGRYKDILNVFHHAPIDYQDFKWIIVYCGTNVSFVPGKCGFSQRQDKWNALKYLVVREANRRKDNGREHSVMFCCSFDHPGVPGNAGHAAFVERELSGTPVVCINWQRIGNPFIEPNGRLKPGLFERKRDCKVPKAFEFRLSHNGLRLLWVTWCSKFPELRCIPYTLIGLNKGVCRQTIEYAPKEPDPSPSAPSTSGTQRNTNPDFPDLQITCPTGPRSEVHLVYHDKEENSSDAPSSKRRRHK